MTRHYPLSAHASVESGSARLVGRAWEPDHQLCEPMASLAEVWSVVLGEVSGNLLGVVVKSSGRESQKEVPRALANPLGFGFCP